MAKGIAVIGDSESVKGFGAVGMEVFICDDRQNAPQLLKTITENDEYAIIYITEELFGLTAKERERYTESPVPAILPIPGASGSRGEGLQRLSGFVEQAVGSDILFKN